MEKNKLVKDIARSLGIDLCGITDYRLEEDRIAWLRLRKEINYETEFEESNIELRLNKELTLEGARSIIVIGLSYNTPRPQGQDPDLRGSLSKVSWGQDYHRVLEDKLRELALRLGESLDFNYKAFVDTGPLIDRELARLAGLGYFGKNCSIINDRYGSFFAIGYIITDIEIANDRPLETTCGDCDLCLRACPTGALEGPYRVNPKKCLSYLTQSKEIAEPMREKMGDRIYGCDSCQLACPKNRQVELSGEEAFMAWKTRGYVDIEELLTMSNREFKEKYGSMSGSWRGKNILKRNSIIALTNLGPGRHMDLVRDQAKSDSPLVRDCALWALEKFKDR